MAKSTTKSNGKTAGRNRLTTPETMPDGASTQPIEPTSFRDMAASMQTIAYASDIELVRLRCHIVGLAPGFLQHSRRGMDPAGKAGSANSGGTSTRKKKLLTPEEMAELAAYYMDENAKEKQMALPWRCLYNAMVAAAVNYKLSGNKTFMDTIAASIACDLENIPLVHANGKPIDGYTIKRDFAAIPPKSGKMVPIGRALVPDWEAKFELIVDPDYYPADLVGFVGGILKDAGKQKGVGVWSPRLKGPYGKFMVKEVRFDKEDNAEFLSAVAG